MQVKYTHHFESDCKNIKHFLFFKFDDVLCCIFTHITVCIIFQHNKIDSYFKQLSVRLPLLSLFGFKKNNYGSMYIVILYID